MRIYKLDKAALNVQNNAAQFLNGITSNILDAPKNAFLDIHGKIVATFDQLKISDDRFLIVLEKSCLENLLKHVDKFIRLSRVKIEQLPVHVYYDLDRSYVPTADEFILPQPSGQLVATAKELQNSISDSEFSLFRLKNNIPQHGVDYRDELILNVNEDFVSFTKGCFLGQELVAKVHNRSKPSWKLVVQSSDIPASETRGPLTSETLDPQTKKVLGFAFIKNN